MLKAKELTKYYLCLSPRFWKHPYLLGVFVILYLCVSAAYSLDSVDQVLHPYRRTNGNSGPLVNEGSTVKKRIIFKLRTLITNVRSINRSLKREIQRLQIRDGSRSYKDNTNSLPLHYDRKVIGTIVHTKNRNTSNLPRTTVPATRNISSPSPTSMRTPLASTTTQPESQVPSQQPTTALKDTVVEPSTHEANLATEDAKSGSVSKPDNCQYNTVDECNQSGPCIWCISARKCLLKDEFLSSCYTSSHSKRNQSNEHCLNEGSCHSCVKSLHCVWCDSAEKCLSYQPVEELNVNCPSSKWYWRSCPYQPTVFLIMLPVLMTICLLILIAICIKYYRSHRKGVGLFHHEDHTFDWNVFKKRKSKRFGDREASPSGRVRSKITIRDCREKSPVSSSPRDKHRPVGRLSPNVNQDGKRRAASFGPSSSGSPRMGRKEKDYPGF